MEPTIKYSRQLSKIQSKLQHIRDRLNSDISKEDKQFVETHLAFFEKMFAVLQFQEQPALIEIKESIAEDIYENIRSVKRTLVKDRKLSSRDIDSFIEKFNQKNEKYIDLIDTLQIPKKLDNLNHDHFISASFPHYSYTELELCEISVKIFKDNNLLDPIKMNEVKCFKTIKSIAEQYNITAYHNFTHGFSVFQLFFAVMNKSELNNILSPIEKIASLIASLGHDVGHRGYNNAYSGKLKTKLAYAYFENGILENMHTSLLFKILDHPDIAFLNHIEDPKSKNEFREMIIASIMATDMTKHARMVANFSEKVLATDESRKLQAEGKEIPKHIVDKAYQFSRYSDRKNIVKNLVHACDIGNPCFTYDSYKTWAILITQEFNYQNNQYVKEAKRGVPTTDFLKYKDPAGFYGGQIFFSQTLVAPGWEKFSILFPSASEFYENLKKNLEELQKQKNALTKA